MCWLVTFRLWRCLKEKHRNSYELPRSRHAEQVLHAELPAMWDCTLWEISSTGKEFIKRGKAESRTHETPKENLFHVLMYIYVFYLNIMVELLARIVAAKSMKAESRKLSWKPESNDFDDGFQGWTVSKNPLSMRMMGMLSKQKRRSPRKILAKRIVKTGFEERIIFETPRGISWIA